MQKLTSFMLLCCLVSVGRGQAQHSITLPSQSFVHALMNKYHVPAVGVSIIENGKVRDVAMFGNLPNHSSAPQNTLFNIASLTKPLTSTMVLMLVSKGEWKLDEPLYHYWIDPDVSADDRHKKLTTRHLLSHQSGLPNWRGHEPNGKLSFAFEPGTQWKYSGEGFEYLRQALERKFKKPFEKLVDSLVCKPAGMTNTHFYWDASVDSSLYANRSHEDGTAFSKEMWYEANPSNLVLTTVSDYAKFGIAVMNGQGMSREVFREMISSQAHLKNNREQGLGWMVLENLSNGEFALVHSGSNPGLNTTVILLPTSKRGVVIFTNGALGDRLYTELISEMFPLGNEISERKK